MVGSFYDPELDEGCAFEELICFHGGLGGPQTRPFILYPPALTLPPGPIIGAAAVHGVLRGWRHALAMPAQPSLAVSTPVAELLGAPWLAAGRLLDLGARRAGAKGVVPGHYRCPLPSRPARSRPGCCAAAACARWSSPLDGRARALQRSFAVDLADHRRVPAHLQRRGLRRASAGPLCRCGARRRSAPGRSVERRRVDRCLEFAFRHGTGIDSARASLAMATPEPAGAWAAMAALETVAHSDALALVDELVAFGHGRRRRWLLDRGVPATRAMPDAEPLLPARQS